MSSKLLLKLARVECFRTLNVRTFVIAGKFSSGRRVRQMDPAYPNQYTRSFGGKDSTVSGLVRTGL
jgi:hypothetical protein